MRPDLTSEGHPVGRRPLIADLHAHLPMYAPAVRSPKRLWTYVGDRLESALVAHAGRGSGNFLADSGEPRVSVPLLERGGVRIALSVLYSAFDEFAPAAGWGPILRRFPRRFRTSRRYAPTLPSAGAVASLSLGTLTATDPPPSRAFPRIIRRLENMERYVEERYGEHARFARGPAELEAILAGRRLALVHCLEGGFHLGAEPTEVRENVRELGQRGVAYITLGHLFFRGVASVAPAIPALSERDHNVLLPQPEQGLTARARAAIETMVEEGVLLDLCHLSETALEETFALLDAVDPDRKVPVIASHAAIRLGSQEYNLGQATVERIAERGGLIGLIAAAHQLSDGVSGDSDRDGLELMLLHADRTAAITGSHRHTAIGSDLGGFIDPLSGLASSASLGALGDALETRYGRENAELIAGENVRRVLMNAWRRRTPANA